MDAPRASLLVDCDTGIDDALALLYLLRDPRVEVRAVTTVFGNVGAGQAAINSLRVLELAGRIDIPVAVGSERTLTGAAEALAPHVHGDDGLGGVDLPPPTRPVEAESAVELLVRSVRAEPGRLHLLATGPLTNLAEAIAVDPDLPRLVAGVTIMGGAVGVCGNRSPAAEANIHHDPEAARAVLAAPWNVTLVPLDVTMEERLTEDHQRRLLTVGTPVASFAGRILDTYFAFYTQIFGARVAPCHDPLAAAIAVGDVIPLQAPTLEVDVECGQGPGRGATIADTRGRFMGYPTVAGARHRVVLATDGTFPERLVRRLT